LSAISQTAKGKFALQHTICPGGSDVWSMECQNKTNIIDQLKKIDLNTDKKPDNTNGITSMMVWSSSSI
jgi:hypothetical protein